MNGRLFVIFTDNFFISYRWASYYGFSWLFHMEFILPLPFSARNPTCNPTWSITHIAFIYIILGFPIGDPNPTSRAVVETSERSQAGSWWAFMSRESRDSRDMMSPRSLRWSWWSRGLDMSISNRPDYRAVVSSLISLRRAGNSAALTAWEFVAPSSSKI